MAESLYDAINYAIQICWDESHGYLNGGTLNPDIDCSGLVYYALQHGGFNVPGYRWDTSTMVADMTAMGFSHTVVPPGQTIPLQHGDILVHRESGSGHAYIYAENVYGYTDTSSIEHIQNTKGICPIARIEAYSPCGHPEPGDQPNENGAHPEVLVHAMTNPFYGGYTWHVLRWGSTPPPPPPPGPVTDEEAGAAFFMLRMRHSRRKYMEEY